MITLKTKPLLDNFTKEELQEIAKKHFVKETHLQTAKWQDMFINDSFKIPFQQLGDISRDLIDKLTGKTRKTVTALEDAHDLTIATTAFISGIQFAERLQTELNKKEAN